MTARCAVTLLNPSDAARPPPGIARPAWRAALAEDVADLLACLAEVAPAVAATASDSELAASLVWPGTPVFTIAQPRPVPALEAAAAAGYAEAVVVAADVPDLPSLHLGKVFRSLGSHLVAAAPAVGGGLVALAARLPLPGWLVTADPTLDETSVAVLRAAAPEPRSVSGTPGWHRLREPADIGLLDPGLEGWDATRALLGG